MSQPAFDFGDELPDEFADPTYTVGELAQAVNEQLRRGFRDGVWVRGEISGLQQRGPHTYFSLVEDGDHGKAVINVQLFAPAKARITPLLRKFRLDLANGMKVRVHGYLDFWAQGGRLGLKMQSIDPKYTVGEIAQSRDEVLRRLVAENLIDANRGRRLSPVPLRVGVVTSVGTAAWHDFHNEIVTSGFGFELVVADVRVQGDEAIAMVSAAIARLAIRGGLDAIVLIRGGGARNELAVFDAEKIARVIAASPIPVLTGLGHEVDRSIADEVAHTALKTPTACAAILISRVAEFAGATEQTFQAIVHASQARLTACDQDLAESAHRIARRTHAAVERADERLAMRAQQLVRGVPAALAQATAHLDRSAQQVQSRPRDLLAHASQRLDVAAARVGAVDPAVQLARGWTITRASSGAIVRSVADVREGDTVVTSVVDGTVTSTVSSTMSRTDQAPASPAPAGPSAPDSQENP